MKHIETQWKTKDGLDIYAQGWEPQGSAPKAVICLVHGVGEHAGRYAPVAEAFGKSGYAFFSADLRGHGRSAGARGHVSDIEDLMGDIDLLLEQARSRYPNLPIILYGHSLGGILVLHYGLKRKPAIKGIIATSAGLRTALELQPVKVYAARILGAILPGVALSSGLEAAAISRDEKVVQTYLADPLVHDKITLGFGRVMIGAVAWTLAHAAEFPLPLLLMHGKQDRIAYPSGSEEFAKALQGKPVTLVLWENAYHELHNDLQKKDAFNTMLQWMDTLLKD